jgi:hypothetical protein
MATGPTRGTLLLEDVIEPVCSPAFLEAFHGSTEQLLESLQSKRLLVSKYRKNDWPTWLAHVGMGHVFDKAEKMVFSSSILTWQAATDNLGIAIGQQHAGPRPQGWTAGLPVCNAAAYRAGPLYRDAVGAALLGQDRGLQGMAGA